MRLKIGIAFAMFCICSLSFGQDYKTNMKSVKDVDIKIEEGSYSADNSVSADRLIIQTSEQSELGKDYPSFVSYTDEEWEKIKLQIQNNKERITGSKEFFAPRVIDTIFITIPSFNNESQLSGW